MREDKQLKKKCSMFETDGSWICGKSKLGWSSTITCLIAVITLNHQFRHMRWDRKEQPSPWIPSAYIHL